MKEINTRTGSNTPKTEIEQLKVKALKSAAEYKKRVRETKHVIVKINRKHVLEVPEKKYLANKDYYDNLKNQKSCI